MQVVAASGTRRDREAGSEQRSGTRGERGDWSGLGPLKGWVKSSMTQGLSQQCGAELWPACYMWPGAIASPEDWMQHRTSATNNFAPTSDASKLLVSGAESVAARVRARGHVIRAVWSRADWIQTAHLLRAVDSRRGRMRCPCGRLRQCDSGG